MIGSWVSPTTTNYMTDLGDVVNRRSLPPLWGLLNYAPRAVVGASKKTGAEKPGDSFQRVVGHF